MTVLRLLIFVRWMYGTGVVLALNEQHVRLCCCVCAWIGRCYWWIMQYQDVISSSYTLCIDLHLMNVWNGCRVFPGRTVRTFILLEFDTWYWLWGRNFTRTYTTMAMTVLHWILFDECIWNGCRIVPGRTARTFVLLGFDTCYIVDRSTQYEVVISRSCALQIHHNGDDGSALIFLCWIYGTGVGRVDSGRTARTFVALIAVCAVLLVFDSVWSRNLSHPRIHYNGVFAAAWSRNLTLTRCPNTLKWWWRLSVDLRRMQRLLCWATLNKQRVRLWHYCVCLH